MARTWTAENSVGIGGSYLCVYGMEGPGGYQFVGRTLQMWNRYRQTTEFPQPWLLRFFDQIRFFEVSPEELKQIRRDFPQGRYSLQIEDSQFSLADYEALLRDNHADIDAFNCSRQLAFDEELARWHADGQFNYDQAETATGGEDSPSWPEDSLVMDSPVSGSVWQTHVEPGDSVESGDLLVVLESMKMEIAVNALSGGRVTHVLGKAGSQVRAGDPLVVLEKKQ